MNKSAVSYIPDDYKKSKELEQMLEELKAKKETDFLSRMNDFGHFGEK